MAELDKRECLVRLGEAIREKRLELQYTQKEVCELIGLTSQGQYSLIESGKRDCEFVTVVKICKTLGVDLNAIIASYM